MSLLQKVRNKDNERSLDEDDLPKIHHELMLEYGWIPLREFEELPLTTLWNLWGLVNEKRKKEHEELEKQKRKQKSKGK